jgi:hypothetical protein
MQCPRVVLSWLWTHVWRQHRARQRALAGSPPIYDQGPRRTWSPPVVALPERPGVCGSPIAGLDVAEASQRLNIRIGASVGALVAVARPGALQELEQPERGAGRVLRARIPARLVLNELPERLTAGPLPPRNPVLLHPIQLSLLFVVAGVMLAPLVIHRLGGRERPR